jgi:DNA-binding NarL/FixJ family response regulator
MAVETPILESEPGRLMTGATYGFVGRRDERASLRRRIEEAAAGRGGLVLVAGEAGVGKTRLVAEALRESDSRAFSAAASPGDPSPYGPVVDVLRTHLRRSGHDSTALGPLTQHLAILLPELGTPPPSSLDRGSLFEAVRGAFGRIAAGGPGVVFLDDLHWAGEAGLEMLLALLEAVEEAPMLLVGAYRSDELPRGHVLRRFRIELRRRGRLHEIRLGPLSPPEARILAAEALGGYPSPALADILYDRSQGIPFCVEELAAALSDGGRLRAGPEGLEIAAGTELPLPESIRDAVLLRTDRLPAPARRALEAAAVLGDRFDLASVSAIGGEEDGILEALDRGFLVEPGQDGLAFRHALTREAIYRAIPWTRRRALHREAARHLERRGSSPDVLAAHWVAARELEPARRALVASAEALCHMHAYGDALRAGRRALELWPEGEDEPGRLAALDRLGRCAELSGDLAEAVRAWSQVAEARKRDGNEYGYAEVQRRLATVHGLRAAWDRAVAAHREAAEAFARHGLPGEAAAERLSAADHLEAAGNRKAALELVRVAAREAERAERRDLEATALGMEGQIRVELGEGERGLEALRAGLSLALANELPGPAAELQYRLGWALSETSEYASARKMFEAGIEFCRAHGIKETEHLCLACYAGVLVEPGDWNQAARICRDLRRSSSVEPLVRAVAALVLGLIEGFRGRLGPARRLVVEAEAILREYPPYAGLDLSVLWGKAVADALDGATGTAADHLRALRDRWEQTDDLHFVLHPLRWGVTFLARAGLDADARGCAQALATVATRKGSPEALAALAHALGECALLDGSARRAVDHFEQALGLLTRIGATFQHAHTQLRAAVAHAAVGERSAAAERYVEAHQTARRLGARPLAADAAEGLRELGEPLDRWLGRRAARDLDRAGLTRRELQVLRLVDQGRSNREIARELFLSPRTVEMHVSNALQKLDCRSRTEAAHRARALGVIG